MHLGMNDNILFQGTTFHVQTEDSGINNPFITTHVFIGGNILISKKTSYEDIVKSDSLEDIVRSIMDDQHKKVIVAIKRGRIDKTGLVKKGAQAQGSATQETASQATAPQAPQEPQTQAPEVPKVVEEKAPPQPVATEEKTEEQKDEPQIPALGTAESFDELILKNLSLDKK